MACFNNVENHVWHGCDVIRLIGDYNIHNEEMVGCLSGEMWLSHSFVKIMLSKPIYDKTLDEIFNMYFPLFEKYLDIENNVTLKEDTKKYLKIKFEKLKNRYENNKTYIDDICRYMINIAKKGCPDFTLSPNDPCFCHIESLIKTYIDVIVIDFHPPIKKDKLIRLITLFFPF